MSVAPLLVLAVGNPSRGDDALGPMLLDRLREAAHSDVEYLEDFQLQVEHALDLAGRQAVLFVDAALPGSAVGADLTPLSADAQVPPASHALRPQAVLCVAQQLPVPVPPAWQLAIQGERFALGEGLSLFAQQNLEAAVELARNWVAARRAERPETGEVAHA
ncbi:MAG: hydrogenase maturation protease [Burkholderiaceae bacterium]|nr:hydrogenase maturation protease [Burkholderiaceae bacterium]